MVEYWRAASAPEARISSVTEAIASTGKAAGDGNPPASEITSGHWVRCSRSRMAEEPTRSAAPDEGRGGVRAIGDLLMAPDCVTSGP